MTHAEMLKGLLTKKKGTPANRSAMAKQRLTMIELSKQLHAQQQAAAKAASTEANEAANDITDVVVKETASTV